MVDLGSGTVSFAEAWVALQGGPRSPTLLDPSRRMLDQGRMAFCMRGREPALVQGLLGQADLPEADVVPFRALPRPGVRPAPYRSGAGMNSASSPGGRRNRPCIQSPARQASFAASIRSFEEATKFHQM